MLVDVENCVAAGLTVIIGGTVTIGVTVIPRVSSTSKDNPSFPDLLKLREVFGIPQFDRAHFPVISIT
ncbi:jg21090 [Pararge aegeria aegeria]|uniref:Jg21090 protein n=1 Tax=Pararge aegeria aegeria TaxID=348720 RepID=A0A8S4RTX4_9NEOP|nr:jg21090 [Pararge aegeria aegeria]